MKTVLCVIIIIGSLLIPVEKADIAKLQPVEAVALCRKDGVTEIFNYPEFRNNMDKAKSFVEALNRQELVSQW